ncbi:Cof subfamily protein (haloacid dehalogenase superfamily) [Aquibacillus albus]|uniref:Cof subfamily protein (Haloacid dehalogenase superfamily) n=1 Tax=Aquibacillus albus TaxID=1168171 RepID=A0ABS2MXM0_9BACI|nr:HAD family hydrolase [Aquibacillus albus]MBM7570636.1 Cof subfamily protein (haloacid dehalogenase superfamily) [Aquibacillus albus]
METKAVFLDMDGTILNHHNEVTNNTKRIIDQLRAKGMIVCIATGRSLKEVYDDARSDLQVDGIVSSNGMIVYQGNDIIAEHSLSRELINEIINKAREQEVYYELHPNEGSCITLNQDKAFVIDEIREPKPEEVGINEWLSRQAAIEKDIQWEDSVGERKYSKFYFFSRTEEKINHWIDELNELKKQIDFTTSTSSNHNVEVMVAGVNKATGIQHLLDHFGLRPEEILVVGDSNNDIPMLEFAGYSVAMKNAPDSIKQLADEVTTYDCDEDGVYHYLKNKFLSYKQPG